MKMRLTKVCVGLIDTSVERRRIKSAFRKDPETRRRLTLLMDAIEAENWKEARRLLAAKWWEGRDKRLECPRAEFIGLVQAANPHNPRVPASGFDVMGDYSDLICCLTRRREPGDITYTVEMLSDSPRSRHYTLRYCGKCVQMTNHVGTVCQKCQRRRHHAGD